MVTRMRILSECLRHITCTRNHNEDIESYRKGVIESYNKIEDLYKSLTIENGEPTEEQVELVLNHLLLAFNTKKVTEQEQTERLESIVINFSNDEVVAKVLSKFIKSRIHNLV